jgi:transposase
LTITCGIDWAESHHDVALVDADGKLAAKRRISDDVTGWKDLLDLLAEHGDSPQTPIPVAIETSRGLLAACLRATGRRVYAINPLAVARYRERHTNANRPGDNAGRPRPENRALNWPSSKTDPSASRMRMHRVPFGNAARQTRPVSAGTSRC